MYIYILFNIQDEKSAISTFSLKHQTEKLQVHFSLIQATIKDPITLIRRSVSTSTRRVSINFSLPIITMPNSIRKPTLQII